MRSKSGTAIRSEIEHIFGRQIVSSRDCIQLSEEIYKKTKIKLNPNTLRRFFGLVKTEYYPSLSTLNILSRYCGFRSLEDVHNIKREEIAETGCVQQGSVLNYLLSLFSETPEEGLNNETFCKVVQHTINFLNTNPSLIEKFQTLVAKTKNGQDFYFEHFINIDKLNSFYGDGLRYYLMEKNSPEGQIFAHSLLIFKHWLTGEVDKINNHFKEVVFQEPKPSASHALQGRYFASLLYFSDAIGVSSQDNIINIHKYYSSSNPLNDQSGSLFSFEFVIAEALILTGYYEEGLYFINHALKRNVGANVIKESMLQNFHLFEALALYKTGDYINAERMLNMVNPSEFYFLSKKYLSILYLCVTGELKRKVAKYEEQLSALIEETGFTRVREVFAEPADKFYELNKKLA